MIEQLYQDLARHRDDWALVEVEQSVILAAQQLQLDRQRARRRACLAVGRQHAWRASNRPQFISLRKVLVRDLDRLRAVPQLDHGRT
jgi:uroporphyrin-3 C-methyltransferase